MMRRLFGSKTAPPVGVLNAAGNRAASASVPVRDGATASFGESANSAAAAELAEARNKVVRGIAAFGVGQRRILEAMRRVPRHQFVRLEHLGEAYANRPLPIGAGQTISQPLVVAIMTKALRLAPGDRVLEVGTGSGYQAAVLAELGAEVYSVEIIPGLAEWAAENLKRAGYDKVQLLVADGYFGWEAMSPFDAIIVTAAPDHVPEPLVRQLRIGGRMVIPVGPAGFNQTLWLIERQQERVRSRSLGPVAFVPLTGDGASSDAGRQAHPPAAWIDWFF